MDFSYSQRTRDLQARMQAFMDQHVYPAEERSAAEVEENRQKGNAWVATRVIEVLDWAIQAHGGGGVSDDFGLAYAYANARTLRLADGPDEVHRNHIGKLELRRYKQ